jgi:hypothetical protein
LRWIVVVLALVRAIPTRGSVERSDAPEVHYESGRLTVDARAVALSTLLQTIGRETGLVVGGVIHPLPVTIQFADVPLVEGLRRLLAGHSFAVTYRSDGAPGHLEVLSVPPRASGPTGDAASRNDLVRAIAQHPLVRVPLVMRGTLRRDAASLGTVLAQARQSTDPTIRRAAWQILAQALGSDASLRRAAQTMPVEPLIKIVRSWAGAHAVELLDHVASHCPDALVRSKATRARQQLASGARSPAQQTLTRTPIRRSPSR